MYLHNSQTHGTKSKLAVILQEYHPLECCCSISCYYLVSNVNQLEVEKISHKCHITWCLTNPCAVYLTKCNISENCTATYITIFIDVHSFLYQFGWFLHSKAILHLHILHTSGMRFGCLLIFVETGQYPYSVSGCALSNGGTIQGFCIK